MHVSPCIPAVLQSVTEQQEDIQNKYFKAADQIPVLRSTVQMSLQLGWRFGCIPRDDQKTAYTTADQRTARKLQLQLQQGRYIHTDAPTAYQGMRKHTQRAVHTSRKSQSCNFVFSDYKGCPIDITRPGRKQTVCGQRIKETEEKSPGKPYAKSTTKS